MAMNPKLLRPRASGFDPKSISGLVQWLDGNDASTLTLVSGAVSAWNDKSGNSRNASQGTANNRPTTTTVNGKTAILFDGANDGLDFTGVARTDETWVVVAEQTAAQTGTRALVNDGSDGGGLTTVPISGNRMLRGEYATGIAGGTTENLARFTVQAAAGAVAMPPVVISQPRSSSGGIRLRINGTQKESYASAGVTASSSSGSVNVRRIGYYSSTLFQFQGWIGELLCWNRALSVAELQRVERYLGKKWGITVA